MCQIINYEINQIALHLAVLDAPSKHLQDIIRLLLIVGADLSIQSNTGLTAHSVALENSNQLALDTFEEFQKAAIDSSIQVCIIKVIKQSNFYSLNYPIFSRTNTWTS